MENGPVEIVDKIPLKIVIFHSYVNVHQRVNVGPAKNPYGASATFPFDQFTASTCLNLGAVITWFTRN